MKTSDFSFRFNSADFPSDDSPGADKRLTGDCETNLGTRIDDTGRTTFFILSRDKRTGMVMEKTYDQELSLISVVKRTDHSRSETFLDAKTGSIRRVLETSELPDGSRMTKRINHFEAELSREEVTVVSPAGEFIRRVEREHIGLRTIFQSQTEAVSPGKPANTVNHYTDLASGALTRREQIEWTEFNTKALTEDFYFDESGYLTRHIKTIFHPNGLPFVEEIKEHHSLSRQLMSKVVSTFDQHGVKVSDDSMKFSREGKVLERTSKFYEGIPDLLNELPKDLPRKVLDNRSYLD